MNIKGFIRECHEKEVFKMLSIYIVSSWVILQVLAITVGPLGLPDKSVTYLIILLLIGFPLYIYYIWKFRLLKYEIQKTEDPNTPYNKSAFQKMYFSSLFVVVLLSGISITLIIKNNFGESFSLEELQNNDKIAVLDFENTTGDEKLNNIGKNIANWIIHGITENEAGQVISSKLVNDYTNILKSQAGTIDLNNLLKNYFNPGKVIDGVFYIENDTLLVQGSIKDGLINRTLITFETIKCNPNSPLDCAEKLKQNILGYLSTEDIQDESGYILNKDNQAISYYEETPPNYQAYEYLRIALDNIGNDKIHLDYLNRSIQKDPNFFEPKVHKITYYYNNEQFKIADSLRLQIDSESNLSNRQKNILLFYESILKGKNDKAYKAQKKEYELAYKDLPTNSTTMTIAMQYVNRPEDIESFYKEIPMNDMVIENCKRFCGFRYYLKGLADVELGNYNEVIKTLVPITDIIEDNYLKRPLIKAFVKSGQLTLLENYLYEYNLTADVENSDYLSVFTGIQLMNNNQFEEANQFFNKIIAREDPLPSNNHLAQSYYYKGDFENAQNIYEKLSIEDPTNFEYIVHLAISYFNNSNFEAAKVQIEKLNNLRTDYQFGAIDYGWAQYYNSIGDKEKAFEFLLKAVVQGYYYTPSTFQNDPHFRTIKDSPEFKNQIMNYWKNKTQ